MSATASRPGLRGVGGHHPLQFGPRGRLQVSPGDRYAGLASSQRIERAGHFPYLGWRDAASDETLGGIGSTVSEGLDLFLPGIELSDLALAWERIPALQDAAYLAGGQVTAVFPGGEQNVTVRVVKTITWNRGRASFGLECRVDEVVRVLSIGTKHFHGDLEATIHQERVDTGVPEERPKHATLPFDVPDERVVCRRSRRP